MYVFIADLYVSLYVLFIMVINFAQLFLWAASTHVIFLLNVFQL